MDVSVQLQALVTLPSRRNPGAHSIGGWVDPRAGMDVLERRKFCCTCWDSKPRL